MSTTPSIPAAREVVRETATCIWRPLAEAHPAEDGTWTVWSALEEGEPVAWGLTRDEAREVVADI